MELGKYHPPAAPAVPCSGVIDSPTSCMHCPTCLAGVASVIEVYNKGRVTLEETVEGQQLFCKDLLGEVHSFIDEDALVAGGAPRNWEEGKLANDFDLYLRSFASASNVLAKVFGERLLQQKTLPTSQYENELGITAIITATLDKYPKPIQFIFVKPDQESPRGFSDAVLEHMDIGLNQIGFYGHQDLSSEPIYTETEAYRNDRKEKTLTIYRSNQSASQLRHTLKEHLPKMVGYYPSYEVILK